MWCWDTVSRSTCQKMTEVRVCTFVYTECTSKAEGPPLGWSPAFHFVSKIKSPPPSPPKAFLQMHSFKNTIPLAWPSFSLVLMCCFICRFWHVTSVSGTTEPGLLENYDHLNCCLQHFIFCPELLMRVSQSTSRGTEFMMPSARLKLFYRPGFLSFQYKYE